MEQKVLKPNGRVSAFDEERLKKYVLDIMSDFPHLSIDNLMKLIKPKLKKEEVTSEEISRAVYTSAAELVGRGKNSEGLADGTHPDYSYVAARAYLTMLYKEAAKNRGYKATKEKPYGSFYDLVKTLVKEGLYQEDLLKKYTREQIENLGKEIDPNRDKNFNFIGLHTLADRYLARGFDGSVYELPQERFMVISMSVNIKEDPKKRIEIIKEGYWALSNLYETVATPTLSNAGKKTGGQLSSCFVDTVEDDLKDIFNSNTDVATGSKLGGGFGVYMGKVRAMGSTIRNHQGKSSGVIPWIRQLNNTAVSVDQLGQRQGAVSVYLDVWHKDIFDFLDLKLNNGDERKRAHDIFTGICIPDLFMEKIEEVGEDGRSIGEWHLFDPHEVRQVMGFSLEDYYDEEIGSGSFRDKYYECVNNPLLSRKTVKAIDIMKSALRSQLETGTPFMFYRDEANRMNPNKHEGMVYGSNLCTEIIQNMSPTTLVKEHRNIVDGEELIVSYKKPGDYVVCNLASINLARAVTDGVLERLINIMVRMLDNVIDVNTIEVQQARATNQKYRAIGLGTFGLHHLLALKRIHWGSKEAVDFNDKLYEQIAYYTIKASMELAKEKGPYLVFDGSEWQTGEYFRKRGYLDKDNSTHDMWEQLARDVQSYGIRNGYLMAVAPNASTSIIAGSTASTDPIMEVITYEEKSTYRLANPAPDYNIVTAPYYTPAVALNQHGSIAMAAKRQRHVDQAQSFNLYVTPDISAKELLNLHLDVYKSRLKTSYYIRSRALTLTDDCEFCSS